MKIAHVYLVGELEKAQGTDNPNSNRQQYPFDRGYDSATLVMAVRPPFHHMRLLRWHLRMSRVYRIPDPTIVYTNVPPTTNNRRGDNWWFRGDWIARLSRGARWLINDWPRWLQHHKEIRGSVYCLKRFGSFRLHADLENIELFAPTHTQYQGHVVRLPARYLIERDNHHMRRIAARRAGRANPDISPWRANRSLL